MDRPALTLPSVEAIATMTDAEVRALAMTAAAAAQQVAAVQAAIAARLAVLGNAKEPPLTAKQAAERLNVGMDWVRDHGAEKNLEIRLSAGTVRYDPEAVERLRRAQTPNP